MRLETHFPTAPAYHRDSTLKISARNGSLPCRTFHKHGAATGSRSHLAQIQPTCSICASKTCEAPKKRGAIHAAPKLPASIWTNSDFLHGLVKPHTLSFTFSYVLSTLFIRSRDGNPKARTALKVDGYLVGHGLLHVMLFEDLPVRITFPSASSLRSARKIVGVSIFMYVPEQRMRFFK
jgi:hypothetical protein